LWLVLALAAAVALWWWRRESSTEAATPVYRVARIERGAVRQSVTATGPLSAIATVNVGSQVSGNIAQLYVDFNDRVTANQLIAEIEPSTYAARVVQAEGDLLVAQAALEVKQRSADRNTALFKNQLIAQSEYEEALSEWRQQAALVSIKEAVLKSARVDLERTKIRSPIDGVVIDRAIDVGQTVQASFAAPTLFILAQDLRQMQITANVSEADIGGVVSGRPVSFTVDAFPGEAFTGTVRQVRNNTTVTNNVVTYPTIITVENPELKLRPGMTANVTILIAQRDNVLRAPNAALRFRPAELVATVAAGTGRQPRTLYLGSGGLDRAGHLSGELDAREVQTGLSDAAFTEIVSGVDEGALVVTGPALVVPASKSAGAATTNPFMPKIPAHGKR